MDSRPIFHLLSSRYSWPAKYYRPWCTQLRHYVFLPKRGATGTPKATRNSDEYRNVRRIAADPKRHILYIDRSVIVINKPFGLVSQRVTPMVPDGQAPSPKLLRQIEGDDFTYFLNRLKDDVNLARNLYPAHRLDKGTTGALLIARSRPHIRNLWGKFRGGDDNFEKKYLALVRGGADAFSAKEGVIDRPILIKGGIPSISPFTEPRGKAKEAITEWKLLASSPVAPVSLLELKLTTGRKHQARVHCAYILQAPILGDIKYSDSHLPKSITEHVVPPTGRMFLHAAELTFERFRREGPQKRFVVRVVAPLPSDFQRICKMLRIPLTHLQAKGGLFIDGKRMPAPRFDVVTYATERPQFPFPLQLENELAKLKEERRRKEQAGKFSEATRTFYETREKAILEKLYPTVDEAEVVEREYFELREKMAQLEGLPEARLP